VYNIKRWLWKRIRQRVSWGNGVVVVVVGEKKWLLVAGCEKIILSQPSLFTTYYHPF